MKPLRLIMSAFGPFSKVVEVPFEDFGASGLFLVTGDTGAGKTTIFDAISFALFGNASGENRTADCFRSDYAGGEDKTYVDFTFGHKGKAYQVTRNPMYKRNKISGTGMTEEKANATLIMPDGAVVSGNSKVTEAVIKLLGIDWRQFKQIAMIAQGEFLQLLTAGSNERSVIFRKVFGTQIYEDIQKKLKVMSNELKYLCEDLDKSIIQYLHGIVCDPESGHYQEISDWKTKENVNQVQKVMELLETMIALDKESYQEEEKNNQLLAKQISDKAAQYTAAENVNQAFQKLRLAREEQDNLLKEAESMRLKEVQLQSGKKALHSVKPVEDIYLRMNKDLSELRDAIVKQTLEAQGLESTSKTLAVMLREKEASQPRINELTVKIGCQEAELQKYDSIAELEKDYKKISDSILKLEQDAKQLATKKSLLYQEQSDKQTNLVNYKDAEIKLLECQSQSKQKADGITDLNQFIIDYSALTKEIESLLEYQKDYQMAELLYNEKYAIYQNLETQFLREQAGIMASSLQEGSPCPVCGSTTHPSKAVPMEGAPSEQQLKKEKQQLEKDHQRMTDASGKCQSQRVKIELLQQQLHKNGREYLGENDLTSHETSSPGTSTLEASTLGISSHEISSPGTSTHETSTHGTSNLETLTHGISTLETIHVMIQEKLQSEKLIYAQILDREKELLINIDSKKQLETRIQEISEESEKLEALITANKAEYTTASNQISSIEGKLSTLRANLTFPTKQEAENAIQADRKELQTLQEALQKAEVDYQNCITRLGNVKAVLADNQLKCENKEAESKAAYTDLINKLKFYGFEDLTVYQSALLTEEAIEVMEKELDLYRNSCERVDKLTQQLLIDTKDKEEKDLSLILEEQEELNRRKKACEEILQTLFSRFKINSDVYHNVQEKYKEQVKKRQEYITVSDLSKTANGELSGKAKIAFEQYVQAFYFNSVINEANKRLYKMSNSQFILLRKEEAGNLKSACGLDLEVMDYYTGKPRSIKSLSGGESFKAALSLALGLSDVIQSFAGGIEVDTMFIDEGFGSLDSNSLEQAIETLNALTMGNRLVGIISHVTELKERIDKKIAITKSIEGSKLALVN